MPKVQCDDKVWRQFIGRTCQDCMERVEGDFKAHTCERLEVFPDNRGVFKPVRDVVHNKTLEEMPITSVKMILAGKKFMNYGKKV